MTTGASSGEQANAQTRKPRVYVTRRIPDEELRLLTDQCDVSVWEGDDPPPRVTLERELHDADGAITLLTDRIDAAMIDDAPRLRVVSNFAVGYDNIDIEAATARGIVVGNTPETLTETTTDFAFALLMAAAPRAGGSALRPRGPLDDMGTHAAARRGCSHATLGLIGLGRIGAEVARRARGFDIRVLYYNRARQEAMERELGLEYATLDDLLAQSDFVSLHTPLTDETAHLFDATHLAQMKLKRRAILINTARGPIVDTDALVEALRSGRLGGAALDVTD